MKMKIVCEFISAKLNVSDTKFQAESNYYSTVTITFLFQFQQAVGGRLPWYAPAQACNGSAQRQPWAMPAEPGPIS